MQSNYIYKSKKQFGLLFRWQWRDYNNRFLFSFNEINKLVIRSLLFSDYFFFKEKIYFNSLLSAKLKRSSISFYRNYCVFTGHSRSVFRIFRLSRHQAKKFLSDGFLVGFRKSSF